MDTESGQFRPVSAAFVQELARAQLELRVYVVTLVGNTHDAEDVLQETNLDLWRKAATYDEGRPFLPWAKRLAWFQVLKYRTGKKRERVVFSEAVVAMIADKLEAEQQGAEARLDALEGCVKKLTDLQRAYLADKYVQGLSVEQMSAHFRHTAAAVVSLLYRLRNVLHDCVEQKLLERV